jgi:hypothetical protein
LSFLRHSAFFYILLRENGREVPPILGFGSILDRARESAVPNLRNAKQNLQAGSMREAQRVSGGNIELVPIDE